VNGGKKERRKKERRGEEGEGEDESLIKWPARRECHLF
tara:strand:+ start:332 stop:445 length:114 start_codon:yes stop_codon:yes gene_type:complete